MKKDIETKRRLTSWLIIALVCIVMVAGAVAVVLWRNTSEISKVSETYRVYAPIPSVEALYVEDYPVNDTLSVDVTILKATDSSGWELLKKDFDIIEPSGLTLSKIREGKDVVAARQLLTPSWDDDHNEVAPRPEIAVYSFIKQTVTVFHTQNKEAQKAVLFRNMERNIMLTQQ